MNKPIAHPNRMRHLLFATLIACSTLIVAHAPAVEQSPAATDKPKIEGVDPATLKRGPWHYTDVWWQVAADDLKEPFQSLEMDFTIQGQVPDALPLYISPIGAGKIDGQMFYGGIQTNTLMCRTREKPGMRDRQAIGRGALLSLWDDRDLNHIQQAQGGFFDSSDHEGDFISVRNRFKWSEGKYTYRVSRLRPQTDPDGSRHAWIGAFITNHTSGEETYLGAVRLKGEGQKLDPMIPCFVEVYGGNPMLDILPIGLTVTFAAPKINGQPVHPEHGMAQFDKGIPDLMEVVPVNANGEPLTDPKANEVAGIRCRLQGKAIVREKRHYRMW